MRVLLFSDFHAGTGRRATLGPTTVVNAGPGGLLWEWDAADRAGT